MKKRTAYSLLFMCIVLFMFVAYMNIDAIVGAYGNGPPYYGRTTNMDKWENPIPTLVVLDIFSIVILFFVGKWAYIQSRKR
jgi:hypothetical protein